MLNWAPGHAPLPYEPWQAFSNEVVSPRPWGAAGAVNDPNQWSQCGRFSTLPAPSFLCFSSSVSEAHGARESHWWIGRTQSLATFVGGRNAPGWSGEFHALLTPFKVHGNHPWPVWPGCLERHPVDRRVMGSIPGQGTYPDWGAYEKATNSVSLSHQCFSLFLSPSLSL